MATIDGYFYSQRKAIVISHTNVGSDLTNFPLCVQIVADADIGAVCQSTGDDLRFSDADGTLLAAEKESFAVSSGAATGVFWINVPTVSSTDDTTIYCYYGNASALAQTESTSVWDSNYKGVWHLNQTETVISWLDSTTNGNNGTNSNAIYTAGCIGGAASFDGSDYVNAGNSSTLNLSNFSLSAWVNIASTNGRKDIISYAHRGYVLAIDASIPTVWAYTSGAWHSVTGTSIGTSSWHRIAANYDGNTLSIVVDNVAANSASYGAISNPTYTDRLFAGLLSRRQCLLVQWHHR